MELVPDVPRCLTLDQLLGYLQDIRRDTPGDFHVHLCTEHHLLKGTQLQEAIKGVAVSSHQGVVILLADSFK